MYSRKGKRERMRIVIDTNGLISGACVSGTPSRIIDACVRGESDLLLSGNIIEEYRRVGEIFTRKQPNVPFERFLGILISKAVFAEPTNLEIVVCRDPDNMKFLESALAGNS